MLKIRVCFLLLFSAALSSIASAETPSIPDTPAGHVLADWLDSFNSGDAVKLEAFIKHRQSNRSVDEEALLRRFTGGFDLLAIEQSTPTRIVFRVKEKDSPSEAMGKLLVRENRPEFIRNFAIYEAPPDAKYVDVHLNSAERTRIVASVQSAINEEYVFPDVAHKISALLQTHLKQGDYDSFEDGDLFAKKLTDDLRTAANDKHLSVDFYLFPRQPTEKAGDDARYRRDMAQANCGFEKAEHLSGNIGYLKITQFAEPRECGDVAIAAMGFVANSDALIFDLRENGGGAPRMIELLSTYLFEKTTHLNDFYLRKENQTNQLWTLPYVPGKRLADRPVYVLVSKNTFSAGEEFSYNLKALKRATLVGETTAGGAHPVGPHRIDAHFTVLVPFARAINPVTKTNWEGVGVEPDMKVPAADALDAALKLARSKLNEASVAH